MTDLPTLVIATSFLVIGAFLGLAVHDYIWALAFCLLGGYVLFFGD